MNGGASRRALSTSTRQPSNEVNRGDTWFVSRRERDIIPGTGVGWPEDEGLVDAHYGRLRRLCELLLGDRHEAEEVSAALFSVDGEPALALAESPVATALGQGGDTDPVCEGSAWLGDAECSDTLYGVEDSMDAIELEAMEGTMFYWNSSDQGG